MSWHSVVISKPAKLSRSNFCLRIEQDEASQIPFEDIAIIVLNHKAISLTHPVLSACAEYGVGLFSTGENFQPNGVFTPFLPHSRTLKVMRNQLKIDRPTAKRVWTNIVKAKIQNQAKCLALSGSAGSEYLQAMAQKVKSGDSENIEGLAGAFYFRHLFGKRFSRAADLRINAALNYGYAILRGAIARVLVAHGFLPAFGIHHRSEQNAFNLADDIIEPFRPIIDLHVKSNFCEENRALDANDKAMLIQSMHFDMAIENGECSVLVAIDKCISSLLRVLENGNSDLLLTPTLCHLRVHDNEH